MLYILIFEISQEFLAKCKYVKGVPYPLPESIHSAYLLFFRNGRNERYERDGRQKTLDYSPFLCKFFATISVGYLKYISLTL